jgi:2-C-methyl-D-erythritol 4-phosphate cytidylyltransferase / 2-C-methyl-D-erythritol 2,4-cyclodiphosphate synthase
MSRYFLVIPAAGSGSRMQQMLPKQYLQVLGKTLLQHTLESIGNIPVLERIVLAVAASDQYVHSVLAALPLNIRMKVELVTGGAERAQSVRNAVEALAERAGPQDWVLVHDAVRPCVRANDVLRLLDEVRSEPAGGLLAQPVRDTLKRGDGSGHVINTVDRSALWQAATPQVFRYSVLLQALQHCAAQGVLVTDEASAIEALGLPVKLVQGSSDNIKLTWPEDLALLEALLQASQAPEQPELSKMQQVRIGQGYDVHRFAEEPEAEAQVTLAGVAIPHSHRLLAHSDGDVLVHALCDALLGALALGDIGKHFPDTDPRYRGISSLLLLTEVCTKVTAAGWNLGNADMTVVAQAPRLAAHIDAMRQSLARCCGTALDSISIKATTTEGLGFAGRREGIACYASVLLVRSA